MNSNLLKYSILPQAMKLFSFVNCRSYTRRLTRSTGKGYNTHRSNKAKNGLYHGKDVRFGHSISHSHAKTKKKWHPNVIKKRVWSYALDDWVRFNMTTTALKAIDNYGGIDNYVLALDNKSVSESNYITKMRSLISAALFHQGLLNEKLIKKLGYHKNPPPKPLEKPEPKAMLPAIVSSIIK